MILLEQTDWVRSTEITASGLKPYLGLASTDTDLDTEIGIALNAAARMFEKRTGRIIAAQTLTQKHDLASIISHRGMRLVLGPVSSITSVSEVDTDGNETALATTKYYYDEFLQSVIFVDGVDYAFSEDVVGATVEASITSPTVDDDAVLAVYGLATKWITEGVDVEAIIGVNRFQSASLMSAL